MSTSARAALLCLALLLAACGKTTEPATKLPAMQVSVLPFKGGAKAAYSIVHDDFCGDWTPGIMAHAIPALRAHGLTAGVGVIAAECVKNHSESTLQLLHEQGFEIVSHSWNHVSLVPCDVKPEFGTNCSPARPDLVSEIDQVNSWAKTALAADITFFIYPYDSVDAVVTEHLRQLGYLGARGGGNGINSVELGDPLRARFQAYEKDLDSYVEQALTEGKWALRELHGVNDDSWYSVPVEQYQAHMDYLQAKVAAHELWVANPTQVVKYLGAHQHCGVAALAGNIISFAGATEQCARYQTGLSLALRAEQAVPALQAMQAGKALPVSIRNGQWVIDEVDPLQPVTLSAP